ncbi:MAG: membrane integrity-associated transporter subunit PqiC [Deltaproteobacteria bacterium]|nr:membrane integrity-associated transporter subunit PqiC [Deltaproteobacteria bacterium]
MKRIASLPGLLLILGVLCGCSILPDSHPQDIYRFPPSELNPAAGNPLALSLRISRPTAQGVLDSTRIVVALAHNQFSVYQDARWNGPAPVLWRNFLLDAFYQDGRISRLSSEEDGVQPDLELGGTLHAFQSEYRNGAPHVVIRLDARLIHSATKRILAGRRFTATERPHGPQLPEVVAAFGRAGDSLAKELIEWTLEGARNETGQP